jgi:hypothetical protein
MSEDSSINKDQRKEEERGKAMDFFGSLGKGMLAKEKIETLGNSSGLTPLSYGVNFRKNTEMLSNSHGLSPFCPSGEIYSIKRKSLPMVEDFSANKGLETVANSSGLTPLDFDSEPQINIYERRSDHIGIEKNPEVIETQGDLSGLSVPLGLCSEFHKKRSDLNDR